MSVQKARGLRTNQTKAEAKLWRLLRARQLSSIKFRRQLPIGPYIVDFACLQHRLVIEIDGGQHADNLKDLARTKYLEDQRWRVIRFWNNEIIENKEGVLFAILSELGKA